MSLPDTLEPSSCRLDLDMIELDLRPQETKHIRAKRSMHVSLPVTSQHTGNANITYYEQISDDGTVISNTSLDPLNEFAMISRLLLEDILSELAYYRTHFS